MAAPRTTVWPLEPRTRAKHAILRRYLQAWLPILSQGGFPSVLYIDGFAGPGRYSGGEDGSPIIALRTAIEHSAEIRANVCFLFVERDPRRTRVLQEIVDSCHPPRHFRTTVVAGRPFAEAFAELRQSYRDRGRPLPPTFAFIDPFGWTGVPFDIIKSVMSYPSCEVLITFMYEEINRFINHPDQRINFDLFFGTDRWHEGIGLTDSRQRNRFLHDLYLAQLREAAGVEYVRSFQMRNASDVTDYYLFYGTNSLRGLQKMKEAMWKVDDFGEFMFSDATDPQQMVLFSGQPRYDELRNRIKATFQGQQVTVAEVERFLLAETAFRETHYKRHVLRVMELADPPEVGVIDPPPGRRRGTFGEASLKLRFLQ